ncbi:hypothetical protein Tsubulata_035743 [Turnera subulata]|uniref:Uncharacterized protein n=1 Tax=Turnera subulata TaxID=218843 RepID=A0A9Q0FEU5_9ROSI|nr:hypothetical protein Tsubulata_035743 [Turnera subulata]
MEANRKRRSSSGFMKSKLIPFYRSAKSSSNMQYSSSKVKPSQTSATASVGYVVHPDYIVAPQNKQKVSFIVPADYHRDKLSQFDKFFGVAGDVCVDSKATSYISSVQERFKLEGINSAERKQQQLEAVQQKALTRS